MDDSHGCNYPKVVLPTLETEAKPKPKQVQNIIDIYFRWYIHIQSGYLKIVNMSTLECFRVVELKMLGDDAVKVLFIVHHRTEIPVHLQISHTLLKCS